MVGLAIFLAILGFCLRCAYGAARRFRAAGDERWRSSRARWSSRWSAMLVADFFASEQFNKVLWLLLAIGPALEAIARRTPSDPGRPA